MLNGRRTIAQSIVMIRDKSATVTTFKKHIKASNGLAQSRVLKISIPCFYFLSSRNINARTPNLMTDWASTNIFYDTLGFKDIAYIAYGKTKEKCASI